MINGIVIALLVAYPVLVYVGIDQVEPRVLGVILVAGLLLRYWIMPRGHREMLWVLVVLSCFAIGVTLFNSAQMLLLYPVVVNLALLLVFGFSLWRPPTAIEYIARLTQDGELSQGGVEYTRKVTWTWCGFFVVNATIAAWTASYASLEVWTLYNGLISYAAIAVLMSIEWLVRQRVKNDSDARGG